MSGLALVCQRLGARVSGSDRAESSYLERLRRAGLEPRVGHDPDSVPDDAEVVVSTAVPEDNPELVRARDRGQRVVHRGELLAEICARKRLIAVGGTHGKTTTAAMIVHALRETGADPAFLLGGELPVPADIGVEQRGRSPRLRGDRLVRGDFGEVTNAGWGGGEWVVAEADESDASFLLLEPEIAVVTNVELDHHAHWSSRADLLEAFGRFCEAAGGVVLPAGGGLDSLSGGGRGVPFDAERPGPALRLHVPGRHNVLNARAALAALELAGAELEPAAESLVSFPGVRRRLELKGRRNGALIYDDYAHHPTEVAAALEALRELRPRRLIAVFQPHLYSRTKAMAEQLGAALAAADEVGVLEVYPAREEPVGELAGVTGQRVAEAAAERAGGRRVWWLCDAERAAAALAPRLGDGDLLVTIGAGDIFRLAEALAAGDPGAGAGPDAPEQGGNR